MERQSSLPDPGVPQPEQSGSDGTGQAEMCPALPSDGINNPPENMLRRFFVNLLLVALAMAAILVGVNVLAMFVVPWVPFQWEKRLVGDAGFGSELTKRGRARQGALRELAVKLADAAELPEGMEVTIHYNPAPIENAFATFGGNIIVFDGIFDIVESEDELSMVLLHEMMHIRNRDSIRGLVRATGLMILTLGMNGNVLDNVVQLGMKGYSRDQERRADLGAVPVLGRVYGHAGGAERFLTSLVRKVEMRNPNATPSIVLGLAGTHPDTLVRLKRIRDEALRLGIPLEGVMTPLPELLDRNAVFLELDM